MTVGNEVEGWLTLAGGLSGLLLLIYCGVMLYYQHRKTKQLDDLKVQIAEIRGMLMMRRR